VQWFVSLDSKHLLTVLACEQKFVGFWNKTDVMTRLMRGETWNKSNCPKICMKNNCFTLKESYIKPFISNTKENNGWQRRERFNSSQGSMYLQHFTFSKNSKNKDSSRDPFCESWSRMFQASSRSRRFQVSSRSQKPRISILWILQRNGTVKFLKFNNSLFAVFSNKKQPKQAEKMPEIRKNDLRSDDIF